MGYGAPLPTAKLPPSSSQPTPELQHLFPGMALTLFLFLIFYTLCCFDILKPFGWETPPPRAGQAVPTAQGPGRLVPHPADHPPRLTGPVSGGHPGGRWSCACIAAGPGAEHVRAALCPESCGGVLPSPSEAVTPPCLGFPAETPRRARSWGIIPLDTPVPLDPPAVP